jgi:hypothetical protein
MTGQVILNRLYSAEVIDLKQPASPVFVALPQHYHTETASPLVLSHNTADDA